ncbi:hypothetical protein NDU88_003954 [Pleurodeles waltl]|uniref:Uncharacterized protein n=1 Tax=Pleurodeles waltl TaxID=8319 RepID=A0AAV7SHK8_PLEWA|nr:hypothetical protein NDU88_003954 [Pleurodeles waltl]
MPGSALEYLGSTRRSSLPHCLPVQDDIGGKGGVVGGNEEAGRTEKAVKEPKRRRVTRTRRKESRGTLYSSWKTLRGREEARARKQQVQITPRMKTGQRERETEEDERRGQPCSRSSVAPTGTELCGPFNSNFKWEGGEGAGTVFVVRRIEECTAQMVQGKRVSKVKTLLLAFTIHNGNSA